MITFLEDDGCTLKTGIPVEEGDSILKLLQRVSRPDIQLWVGIHSELHVDFFLLSTVMEFAFQVRSKSLTFSLRKLSTSSFILNVLEYELYRFLPRSIAYISFLWPLQICLRYIDVSCTWRSQSKESKEACVGKFLCQSHGHMCRRGGCFWLASLFSQKPLYYSSISKV